MVMEFQVHPRRRPLRDRERGGVSSSLSHERDPENELLPLPLPLPRDRERETERTVRPGDSPGNNARDTSVRGGTRARRITDNGVRGAGMVLCGGVAKGSAGSYPRRRAARRAEFRAAPRRGALGVRRGPGGGVV